MGTRGFVSFVADGTEKTAYVQFDSYPEGLGLGVLHFLQAHRHELTCERHSRQSGSVPDKIRKLRVVSSDAKPTPEDIERLRKFANTDVGSRRLDEWYVLLRETQGDPAAMLEAGVIEDASDFPRDSLWAEYGYVIDLDAKTFEVYEGFQQRRHTKGRFADRERVGDYYPVALAKSWPLAELPTDTEFVAAFGGDD